MIYKNSILTTGGLLVNPLCGEPILAALGDSVKLTMATVLWWVASNKLCKSASVVVTKILIIRFVLYYCPQDLAFQFRLIGLHHQSCYYSLLTTCLAYMHWWWWYLLSAKSSQYGSSSTWSRHSTTPRKYWLGSNMLAMCFPAIFWVNIILHLNCYNIQCGALLSVQTFIDLKYFHDVATPTLSCYKRTNSSYLKPPAR